MMTPTAVLNSSVSYHSSFLGGGMTRVLMPWTIPPSTVEVATETMLPAYTPPVVALWSRLKTGPTPKTDCQRVAREPCLKVSKTAHSHMQHLLVPEDTPKLVKPMVARIGRAKKSMILSREGS